MLGKGRCYVCSWRVMECALSLVSTLCSLSSQTAPSTAFTCTCSSFSDKHTEGGLGGSGRLPMPLHNWSVLYQKVPFALHWYTPPHAESSCQPTEGSWDVFRRSSPADDQTAGETAQSSTALGERYPCSLLDWLAVIVIEVIVLQSDHYTAVTLYCTIIIIP